MEVLRETCVQLREGCSEEGMTGYIYGKQIMKGGREVTFMKGRGLKEEGSENIKGNVRK